jgi:hypothetical protein
MKVIAVALACVALATAQMDAARKASYTDALSRDNSLQPEWHETPEEGNGLVGLKYSTEGTKNNDHMTGKAADIAASRDNSDKLTAKDKFHGGTSDVKDLYNTQLGAFDNNNENVNMTPYVIQTKDEKWEAGVPNYDAPENGYLIQTFDVEADARAWVIEKTGADNTINYPLAPDVDPEYNLANPNNPADLNPNVMQDNAPTNPPEKQLGHMEPAYVGEYDEKELFGDTHSDTVEGTAEGEDHGDLQKAIYMQKAMKARRTRALRN